MPNRWGPLSYLFDRLAPTPQDVPDRLAVASSNFGKGHWRNLHASLYGWQEAADQRDELRKAEKAGIKVYSPSSPGASTPIGYDPRIIKEAHPFDHIIHKHDPSLGSGAGKEKHLVGITFTFLGMPGVFGNLHNYNRQHGRNKEAVASHNMVRETVGIMRGYPGFKIVTMDANTDPRGYAVEPLRQAGFRSLQLTSRIATHGVNWSPDQIWYLPTPMTDIKATSQYGVNVGSDHLALVNLFDVRSRMRARQEWTS